MLMWKSQSQQRRAVVQKEISGKKQEYCKKLWDGSQEQSASKGEKSKAERAAGGEGWGCILGSQVLSTGSGSAEYVGGGPQRDGIDHRGQGALMKRWWSLRTRAFATETLPNNELRNQGVLSEFFILVSSFSFDCDKVAKLPQHHSYKWPYWSPWHQRETLPVHTPVSEHRAVDCFGFLVDRLF